MRILRLHGRSYGSHTFDCLSGVGILRLCAVVCDRGFYYSGPGVKLSLAKTDCCGSSWLSSLAGNLMASITFWVAPVDAGRTATHACARPDSTCALRSAWVPIWFCLILVPMVKLLDIFINRVYSLERWCGNSLGVLVSQDSSGTSCL